MAAADPEHVAWLTERKLARAWPTCWNATANANGVRSDFRVSHSTWGGSTWHTYHLADVARVAGAIADGTAALQPHWRNDTPEAKLLDQHLRRKNLPGAIGCALVIAVALAIVVTIVVLSWNDSSSSYSPPSYWH
ncbi:hypothetical protein ABZ153_39360 [Streptomyces sp. NPDC006290]|uniref:hypothetical protein n=1 Tax=Streptomyces sp. NPDC006290 TaxID=3156745 RepID=UPI0033A2F615